MKTTPPRSGLTWKLTGRIFTPVGLKWIPIKKFIETRYNTNDSASPLGKETHNPNTVICANSSSFSVGTSKASEPISSQGIMEMEPDIENMMLNEFLEYTNHESEKEAEVEDDDNGDTYDIWDITIEDIGRIRQFLMPNIPDEMDEVIQPLISQPIHTTLPNDDYVAPATKSILDEILEEFND
ncbi:hypothetical protein Tco_1385347 [Tanacetum coccineum]